MWFNKILTTHTKDKINMNRIHKLITACLIFVFSITIFSGCSNNNPPDTQGATSQSFIGILIYQNTPNNTIWNNIDDFENYVSSEISFENTITTSNKFLFYIFNNSESLFLDELHKFDFFSKKIQKNS